MFSSSSKFPIIGISASICTIDTGSLLGRERVFIGQDYIKAIIQAGGIPIVLPLIESEDSICRQVDLIDGLMLSGGYDVDPHFYGEEPHHLLEATYRERDLCETVLVRAAAQKKIPILGICRGLQLINVAFGGSLYQDLTCIDKDLLQHRQKTNLHEGAHTVDLEKGTILEKIYNQESIRTNSLHHQSIKKLAEGFKINAKSRDGIIEGIEKMDQSFILGLQWHPELMFDADAQTRTLFRAFIDACQTLVINDK